MKYYVVSDVHGFYSEMEKTLRESGFFEDTEPHKLIICGDLLDRGQEAFKVQDFALKLLHSNGLIFVRGNHEDLMVDMISSFNECKDEIAWGFSHHVSNGTFDSALQLSGMNEVSTIRNPQEFIAKVMMSAYYKELIPESVNFFETDNYVFVHGWIACNTSGSPPWYIRDRKYSFNENWRNATKKEWEYARWFNGMDLSENGVIEQGKTVVCGHWHTSYGHCKFEYKCSEFGKDADFTPYYGKNIIAIDACTAHSGLVNCVVIKD